MAANDPKDGKDPKRPEPTIQRLPETPQGQRPVAEREPLTVSVLPTPAVETQVEQPTQVILPTRVGERRHGPGWGMLLAYGAGLLFLLWRIQLSPFVLRLEHGLQRRVMGERTYFAHREPRAGGMAINR